VQTPTLIVHELSQTATLLAIRDKLDANALIEMAVEIQQIPAPTFAEEKRATFLKERFVHYGLQDVTTDDRFNVYGRWPGQRQSGPALMVSAHTDTVFPQETHLTVRSEKGRIYGPGLGDNSMGVAALLALLDTLQTYQITPEVDIWFVANSREEGLGDLGGMRAAWQKLGNRLGAAIVLEGMALGRIYRAGIAVRRLRITCTAPGGHSWLHFGQPTAIHGLIELGAQIIALTVPSQPRTTYNIGLIEGGHSVNSLATSASLYLDLRSEETAALATLEQQVLSAIDRVQRPDLSFAAEIVGDRPAGSISIYHPLVQLATATLQAIDIQPVYETGSTDANILLANGLPTVTVGITHGGNAHRLDEYIETEPTADGFWHVLLLILSTAKSLPGWQQ